MTDRDELLKVRGLNATLATNAQAVAGQAQSIVSEIDTYVAAHPVNPGGPVDPPIVVTPPPSGNYPGMGPQLQANYLPPGTYLLPQGVEAALIQLWNENTIPGTVYKALIHNGDFKGVDPYVQINQSSGGFTYGPKPMPGHPRDTCIIPKGQQWYFTWEVVSGPSGSLGTSWSWQPTPP